MLKKLKNLFEKIYFFKIKRDKAAYARKLGVHIGEKCQILDDPRRVFGTEPWLIRVGDHVDITAGVRFLTHEGGMWYARGIDPAYEIMDIFQPIFVGNNVMIGAYSLIMPGVHIGNNVIIGGHSVVTRDISDGSVMAGIPAKQISTVDSFMKKNSNKVVPTKKMSQTEKREWLKGHHPEWFEKLTDPN